MFAPLAEPPPMPAPATRSPRAPGVAAMAFAALSLGVAALLVGCENVSVGDIGPSLEDEAPLTQAVRAALDARPELGGLFIKVKSLDGDTVRLSGRVDTDAQRTTAEQVAASVDGVRSVINTLFVRD